MIVLLMMINWADKSVLGLAAVEMMHDLNMSQATYASLSSIFFIPFLFSAMLSGFFIDRVRSTLFLSVLALIWAIASGLVAVAGSVAVVYAARALLGAGEGPSSPVSTHTVQQWFPAHRRGLPSALINVGAMLGVLVAAPLLGKIIDTAGWRWAFGALAIAGLVWLIAWQFIGRDRRPVPDGAGAQVASGPTVSLRALLLNRTWIAVAFTGFVAYWVAALGSAYAPMYAVRVAGFTSTKAASILALGAGLGVLISLGVMAICQAGNKRGSTIRRTYVRTMAILLTIGCVCLIAARFAPAGMAPLVLLVLGGSAVTAIFPLQYIIVDQLVPFAKRGAAFSTTASIAFLAGVLAPLVTGRLLSRATVLSDGFRGTFLLVAVLLALATLATLFFIHPDQHRYEEKTQL